MLVGRVDALGGGTGLGVNLRGLLLGLELVVSSGDGCLSN